jgi:hypothetical protein
MHLTISIAIRLRGSCIFVFWLCVKLFSPFARIAYIQIIYIIVNNECIVKSILY